ncbi:uncharacterized protein METZ01_LOCUS386979 [marine metagenome]|uniref:Uncharacterized protein n=1 Tax=marine metagenome TaxID=408172 RepID=A0A382UJV9_9ZZZZ
MNPKIYQHLPGRNRFQPGLIPVLSGQFILTFYLQ